MSEWIKCSDAPERAKRMLTTEDLHKIVDALRNCVTPMPGSCGKCSYQGVDCRWNLMIDAADALEATEKRIDELEKQVAAYEKLAKRCGKQMCKIERENDELQRKLREKIIMLQRKEYTDG